MTNGTERESGAPAGFRRELGLWDATVVVAGAILGVGIFVNPSNVARILPDPGWMLAAWIAGGAVALLGGFVYAELGARLPEVGGQYVYLARSWSPFAGYLYGVTLLFVVNSGGMAAVASVLASYVDGSILPLGQIGRPALAGAVLIALAEINVRGVRPAKRVNNSLMALKLAGIAILIGLALLRRPEAATRFAVPAAGGATLAAFFAALVPILFAYGGWQNCGSVAAEIRDPRRTLARANVLGVGLIVAVYVGLVVLDLWVLSPRQVAGSDALAADVARTLVGAPGARFVGVLIVLSCLGFLAVMTMTGPRLYYAMAADGLFWRRAARLHPRFSTPSFTIRLQAAVALVLLLSQTYDQLLSYVVFGDWLFFALTAAGLFVLRRRQVDPAGGFRVPGHPVTTALFVAVGAGVVADCFVSAPAQAAAGCGVIAAGALSYLPVSRRRRSRQARPR
jgi:basic amino acid/polyamine antiporter, APA family